MMFLAKGSFGKAILVRSTRDKQLYTAKVNENPKKDDVASVEQNALNSLRHPNIVFKKEAYYDPADKKGLTLILEYCEYLSL